MSKYYVLYSIIFFVPFSLFAMDQDRSIKKIISGEGINEVEFLGNNEIVISEFFLHETRRVDLVSGKTIKKPYERNMCAILDEYEKKALFSTVEIITQQNITNAEYSSDKVFIAFQAYPHTNLCARMEYGDEDGYMCDCNNRCYILYVHNNHCIALNDNNIHHHALAIHPNNKFITTLSGVDNLVHYWCAQTGNCVATHQSPTPIQDKAGHIDYVGRRRLSFSADGNLLAAVFPTKCVVFNVPLEVLYGMGRDKLMWILWCLKNYETNGSSLPKDIVNVLFDKLKV